MRYDDADEHPRINDDAQEKAVRLQSRQALQDVQMNQLKAAAASPMRRLHNHARAASSSPKTTPGGHQAARGKENEEPGLTLFGGSANSPVKRVPYFEVWMKMATDNVCSPGLGGSFSSIPVLTA
jgi:condensin complex subunit 2